MSDAIGWVHGAQQGEDRVAKNAATAAGQRRELTRLVGGGPGAAADGEAATGGELEHLLPGDVEGGEQLRVGEEAAQARHLGRRGVVHGGAARGRGVLGGLEVRRARQQLLKARQQVL